MDTSKKMTIGLTLKKNSISIDLAIFDINLPTSFRCIKILKRPTIFLSNFNIDVKDICPSLNNIRIRLQSKLFFFYRRTRLMDYKYTMRPSEQRFTIFILYCIYIFRVSSSRIFLYFFSLKRYLFKHRRVFNSTNGDFLQVLATNTFTYQIPSIRYQLP